MCNNVCICVTHHACGNMVVMGKVLSAVWSQSISLRSNCVQEDSDAVSEDPGKSERSMRKEDRGKVEGVSEVSSAEQ